MSDIERILAEELPPLLAADRQVLNDEKPERTFPRHAPAEHLKPTQWPKGVSGNPLGGAVLQSKATLTRALREAMTIRQAETLAQAAIEQAEAGNLRALEFIRDSLEGKPGVRIADGEWNPETAPQFAIWQTFAQEVVGNPQTQSVQSPDSGELDSGNR